MAHHAYLLVGPKDAALERAFLLHDLPFDTSLRDPDVQVLEYGVFGIGEARALEAWANQRPLSRERRVFIVLYDSITHETQNALLKLFEEPPRSSVFVLIVPEDGHILPTLRSRFETIRLVSEDDNTADARSFLKLTPAERLEAIASRYKAKDTAWGEALLRALEGELYKKETLSGLSEVVFASAYMKRRGASPKMLLEHIALSLP